MKIFSINMFVGICILFIGCASIKESYVDTKTFRIKKRLNLHKKQDEQRWNSLRECKEDWVYEKMCAPIDLKILQYRKAFKFDLLSQPAMIIGVTTANDFIRIFIYNYQENLSKGDLIKVYPDSTVNLNDQMSLFFIEGSLPIFLSRKKSEDSYFCDIKKTYFGKIDNKH